MLTRSRSMAAPEAAGEIVGMERVSDSPRPTTTADTAPKPDPTIDSTNTQYTMIMCVLTGARNQRTLLPHSETIMQSLC